MRPLAETKAILLNVGNLRKRNSSRHNHMKGNMDSNKATVVTYLHSVELIQKCDALPFSGTGQKKTKYPIYVFCLAAYLEPNNCRRLKVTIC